MFIEISSIDQEGLREFPFPTQSTLEVYQKTINSIWKKGAVQHGPKKFQSFRDDPS